ncbi:MAG: hypothetical protein IRY99_24295 [Isosphaeraceae bacterium]|nr:hypothetical protein [Isosphaeraceae bacterium]
MWRECSDTCYTNLLVRAPCDEVARAFQQQPEMPKRMGDLLAGQGPPTDIREEPVYV